LIIFVLNVEISTTSSKNKEKSKTKGRLNIVASLDIFKISALLRVVFVSEKKTSGSKKFPTAISPNQLGAKIDIPISNVFCILFPSFFLILFFFSIMIQLGL
jgi:hypothetical protein